MNRTTAPSATSNFVTSILGMALCLLAIAFVGCSAKYSKTPTQAAGLRDGLGLDENEGWIILARPNSLWQVGTIIEIRANNTVSDIGLIQNQTDCFPQSAWQIDQGEGSGIQYGREIDYRLNVSATFGVAEQELAKAGLNLGSDGKTPAQKVSVVFNKVKELRLDKARAEGFLEKNFEELGLSCKRALIDPNRFIIDKILVIEDGEIIISDLKGMKIDLSAPQYEFLRKAALEAGYSVKNDGSLKVGEKPITFAVRQADFESTLERMGIQRRGERLTLAEMLLATGESLPY